MIGLAGGRKEGRWGWKEEEMKVDWVGKKEGRKEARKIGLVRRKEGRKQVSK